MAVVSFAVINLFDFILRAERNDDIRSFSVLFSPNITQWIAEIEMKQSTACEHI